MDKKIIYHKNYTWVFLLIILILNIAFDQISKFIVRM
ncbi:MAG: signal peptidase II, partial [Chryseobacterium sp.]